MGVCRYLSEVLACTYASRPGAGNDVRAVLGAAENRKPLHWIVPKGAHANDRILFHLPGLSFAAHGVIVAEPRQYQAGSYRSTVRDITLLASAVPLAFVRKNHPSWKWPTYPRSYTTIDGSIETRLER